VNTQKDRIKLDYFWNYSTDFLKLVRVFNLLILVITQYSTRTFIVGEGESIRRIIFEKEIFFISLCTILVASAGYIINDYYDIKIDMVNKPERVVLNKSISRRMALILHFLVNIMAICIAYFFLTLNVAIFVASCGFLLWLYSNYLKRTAFFGNLSISFLAFATLFMVGLFYEKNINFVLLFGFFAFITTLIREIIKDIEDIRGDLHFGCKTLPIVIGIAHTKKVLLGLLLFTVFAIIISERYFNKNIYSYFIIATVIPLLLVIYQLIVAQTKKSFHRLSSLMKMIMVAGISGMVLL
jgi:4-hydroxybenzoate polyprenyltransferase